MEESSVATSYTLPSSFLIRREEAFEMMEKDNRFKAFLQGIDPRYAKKTKQNKLNSRKHQFLIMFYYQIRKREIEKNAA